MRVPRRHTDGPMPGEWVILPGVSPRINSFLAAQTGPEQNLKADIEARDMKAALDANPVVAKRLIRNQKLWIIIPSVVFIAFFVIVYFLP